VEFFLAACDQRIAAPSSKFRESTHEMDSRIRA
jgi:hypothetical protein